MIKINYIIDDLNIGGAQTHLLQLASTLSHKEFLVEVVCLGHVNQMLTTHYPKIKIRMVNMCSIRKISFWKGFINLIGIIKEEKPNIVHTYLSTANVFGAIAARIAKVKIIITSRRDMGYFHTKRIAFLERCVNNFTDKVVCVSEAVRKNIIISERVEPDKITVIYNGVNTGLYSNEWHKLKERDIFMVGIVAGMNREMKGHRYFIEAAEEVINKRKDVKFILVGDGPLGKKLEDYVNNKGLKEYFYFRGNRENIKRELEDMDILVSPSLTEGFSNAILEAMAMGIPVIATAVDGNLESVADGQTGILVPPKDPQAIAGAIVKILKDRALAEKMGENARKLILENFTLEIMTKNYISLYEELINCLNPRSSLPTGRQARSSSSAVIRDQINPSFASVQNSSAKDPEHSEGRSSAKNLRSSVSSNLCPSAGKKIGYIVSLFPCWSETFILNELIELRKRGYNVSIFSIRKDFEEFTQEKAKQFINNTKYPDNLNIIKSFIFWLFRKPVTLLWLFLLVSCKRYMGHKTLVKNIWSIFVACGFAGIARKEKITHLHAHFATYPALVALVISKLTGIPYSFTIHAHDIFLEKALLSEKAKGAKAVVAISDYNKQYLNKVCQNGVVDKTRVIHCGLDLAEFTSSKNRNGENVILSIGRLTKMKGFEYLIKACSRIKNNMPIKCRIIGDGPLRDELERLIISLGVRDCVRIEGVLDNNQVKQLLRDASVFVLSSVWDKQDGQDGLPLVLIEAMAQGVPVISSNISGIPELVEDNKTGLLVDPGNVEQLSQKILQLLSDKELQSRLATAGRKKVEQEFNIEKSVEKLIRIFIS